MTNNDRVYYSHDAEVHAVREMTKLVILCLLAGLGIGATMALLFAPESGKNTRKDLAKNIEEGLKSGRETLEPVVKQIEGDLAELRKNVEERMK